ncbi:MAG: hypothetical protein JXR25_03600 [Pontiellaceae bacterium]|nr:hypothetical protein [Pontiellaceae bacterium]MBN2783886.1 hypothetical protein [Pontiellaceae bacterium]
MKAAIANLLNALVLIGLGLGLWGYFGSGTPSATAFIPVGFGVILLGCHPGVRKENKVVAHIAVLLTLIILVALIKPLTAAVGRDDEEAAARVTVMMVTSLVAMFFFIKSFVDVRRARAAAARASA